MSILLKCAPLRLAPFILRRCGRCLLLQPTRDLPSSRQITFSGNKDKVEANCDNRLKHSKGTRMEDDVSTIPAFKSQVNTEDPAYKENYAEMQKIVAQLHERLEQSRDQGDARSIERHLKAGQLLGKYFAGIILSPNIEKQLYSKRQN